MAEKYVELFLKEVDSNKENFEKEKEVYQNVKSLIKNDLKKIEAGLRPITEYISSYYSAISDVRQVADYEQLSVNYKEHTLISYRFYYNKEEAAYYINLDGEIALPSFKITVIGDKASYTAESREYTVDEIIENHVKKIAEYVAADYYRI